MKFSYETNRLLLKILDGSNANDVLRFYLTNREPFEQCEALRPENFYTEDYQRRVLNHEFNMCIKKAGIRFWIYKKTDPLHVIGTVCFRNIMPLLHLNILPYVCKIIHSISGKRKNACRKINQFIY